MVMQGTVSDMTVLSPKDIKADLNAEDTISLYGAQKACITLKGNASGAGDVSVNLSCTGVSLLFPDEPNVTLSLKVKSGEFCSCGVVDLSGYAEVRFENCSSSVKFTDTKVYFQPVY